MLRMILYVVQQKIVSNNALKLEITKIQITSRNMKRIGAYKNVPIFFVSFGVFFACYNRIKIYYSLNNSNFKSQHQKKFYENRYNYLIFLV